eukprot:9194621-Ditylum_brightwellii.AAC.1
MLTITKHLKQEEERKWDAVLWFDVYNYQDTAQLNAVKIFKQYPAWYYFSHPTKTAFHNLSAVPLLLSPL